MLQARLDQFTLTKVQQGPQDSDPSIFYTSDSLEVFQAINVGFVTKA